MDNINGSIQYGSGGSINSGWASFEDARVVETTVEEYFDEDGKLTSRTTKTVTRYEKKTPNYYVTY